MLQTCRWNHRFIIAIFDAWGLTMMGIIGIIAVLTVLGLSLLVTKIAAGKTAMVSFKNILSKATVNLPFK
jgi:hypothetical protein